MHSPAARALLQPCALLHDPRDTLKDLILAGHVITITYRHHDRSHNPLLAHACARGVIKNAGYRAFQVACNGAMNYRSSHVIKLKLSSQLIGQFGHVTASASCKQPEKHGTVLFRLLATGQ